MPETSDATELHLRPLVEALRRSEQNFRTIIEQAPVPMCVSRTTRIVYSNKAMLDYLGYDASGALLGPTLAELSDVIIHPDDRARTRDAFGVLFGRLRQTPPPESTPVVRVDNVRLRRKPDGALRHCDMHGVVVLHDGEPALVTYLHDHSEQQAAAARMRVAEHMASLGTLAAGVGHEINNPLTYVIANVELAAGRVRTSDDGAITRLLDDARQGLERIRKIVRSLKTFSRHDDETIASVDVVSVLESCIEMAESHVRHRGRFVRRFAEAPPVRGSDARLAQVFLNLIVNAAEALDEAKREQNEVTVGVHPEGRDVVVEIGDTGSGIAPADVERIFDPFFTTKPPGSGTGLGLFVCHGIVSSLGGEITVDSAVGRGTTVRVRLRAAAVVSPSARPGAVGPDDAGSVARGARATDGSSLERVEIRRLLVVDDEPALLKAIHRMLADEFDVTVASSAREALELLAAGGAYHLVLCDLMMPDMTGAELHARLEAESPETAGRFAFMTGGAVSEAGRGALQRTSIETLKKPFTPEELLSFVRRYARAR